MRVAIVGASESHWNDLQKVIVKNIIKYLLLDGDTLISGRCPKGGVDIFAEEIADKFRLEKEIYPPETHDWEGYKKRNIQIAKECNILFDIEPMGRKKSGGLWTLNYAKKLGKQVVKIEVS